ncbi:baeRF12 domain-containing protein [Paracoccus salsus]|uniref:baeRF12 domain-containing protein n=1 Tax=Paracoccus salsus TaxID=2911061 RepID=UPI001F46C368|nr:host attachment protein [Paracoccus salsus]MCF3972934.1 host attachment family protein [Paracoccus salsus]
MLSRNALVVVADGHSATLFRNRARHGLELEQTRHLTQQDFTDGELVAESTRDIDEAAFATGLAEYLNNLVLRQKADELAIVADPATLGQMRKKYHKQLEQRLAKEVAKTLNGADVAAIERVLA